MPIGGHGHTDARTTDQHAVVDLAVLHQPRHDMGIIGIVCGVSRISPDVVDRDILCLKEGFQLVFELITGVVRPDGNGLDYGLLTLRVIQL